MNRAPDGSRSLATHKAAPRGLLFFSLAVRLNASECGGPVSHRKWLHSQIFSSTTGQAGFVFGLDAAQWAGAGMAIDRSGPPGADVRVGLWASLTDATGGPETFFIGSASPAVTPVPEAHGAAMLAAGLALFGFLQHRRSR